MRKDGVPDGGFPALFYKKRHYSYRCLPWTINCWLTPPSPRWTVAAIATLDYRHRPSIPPHFSSIKINIAAINPSGDGITNFVQLLGRPYIWADNSRLMGNNTCTISKDVNTSYSHSYNHGKNQITQMMWILLNFLQYMFIISEIYAKTVLLGLFTKTMSLQCVLKSEMGKDMICVSNISTNSK